MNITEKKSNRATWKQRIIDWRNTGLSPTAPCFCETFVQGEYCRRNNIDSRQFSKWKLKLEDPNSVFTKTHEADFNSFVEVPLVSESSLSELNIGLKVKADGEIIISIRQPEGPVRSPALSGKR